MTHPAAKVQVTDNGVDLTNLDGIFLDAIIGLGARRGRKSGVGYWGLTALRQAVR